jgi:hypothetical protein
MLCRWVVSGLVLLVSLVSVAGDGERIKGKLKYRKKKMKENEIFLKRSDDLALKLRMNLTDLARHIDLSDGSFFGYRTGRVTISAKAWRKLEAAERAAGIDHFTDDVVSKGGQLTRELASKPPAQDMESKVAEMGAKIDRLTDLVEQLLEQRAASARQAEATSSSSRGSSSREKTRTTTPKKLA